MEVTPALVSEPYLTIQHGIVVLPSSSVATPAFASMPAAARPGIAVQDFRGAQDFRAAQDSEQATRLGGP
jgi:hypothetical protein